MRKPTRIDYIGGPLAFISARRVSACEGLMQASQRLQRIPANKPTDHIPMWALVDLRLGYTNTPVPIPIWNRDLLVSACHKGTPNTFDFRQNLQDWAKEHQQQFNTLSTAPLHEQYTFVLDGLRNIAQPHYGVSQDIDNPNNPANERKAFSELRIRLLKQRQQLRLFASQQSTYTSNSNRLHNIIQQWKNISRIEPLQRQLRLLKKIDRTTALKIREFELRQAWFQRSSFQMWSGINNIANTVRSARSHGRSAASRLRPSP